MVIQVVRGNPTAEELAALLVVLHARAASAPADVAVPDAVDVWADKTRITTKPWPGPGAWRTSYWPR